MKSKLLIAILYFNLFKIDGQVTDITPGGSTQPNISATSTTNGIVFPRMTTAQKEAMLSVVPGTMVYDINLNCLNLYNGTEWTCLNTPTVSNALTFQNLQLTLNPSGNCPLCGSIAVTASQPVKLSYTVKGQDGEDFTFSNEKFSVDNDTTVNLFGLYPNFTNTITATITSINGLIAHRTLYVKTDSLPAEMPKSNEITVNARNSNILTKFIMFFPVKTTGLGGVIGGYTAAMDTYGKIRWLISNPSFRSSITMPIKNGHYLVLLPNSFKEIDLMGNVIRTVALPFATHHDIIQLPNNNLVYLGESNLNSTIEDKVYTVDFNSGALIDSLNIYTILDPLRPQLPFVANNDWLHANSIVHDELDNSVIISARNQSAIFKINLSTKQLKWIISDATGWNSTLTPYLLTPTGSNFEQQWGQHSVILNPLDHKTILLFDNGNSRSYTNPIAPIANYSRCVEYNIDEVNKRVSQNFEFGKSYGSALFAPYVGNVQYINNERIFVNYGGVFKDNNNNAVDLNPNGRNQIRLFEVDKNKNVYFDISIKSMKLNDSQLTGFRTYRAHSFNFK